MTGDALDFPIDVGQVFLGGAIQPVPGRLGEPLAAEMVHGGLFLLLVHQQHQIVQILIRGDLPQDSGIGLIGEGGLHLDQVQRRRQCSADQAGGTGTRKLQRKVIAGPGKQRQALVLQLYLPGGERVHGLLVLLDAPGGGQVFGAKLLVPEFTLTDGSARGQEGTFPGGVPPEDLQRALYLADGLPQLSRPGGYRLKALLLRRRQRHAAQLLQLTQKKVNVLLGRQQGQRFHFYNGQTSHLPGQDRADGAVTVLQGLGPEGIALACGLLQNDLAVSSGLGLRLCQQ